MIRWGMIGCGDVAEVKSGPAFYKAPHSFLQAVMRRDGSKAADFAKRHGVPVWYDNAEKLINDPCVDAVYIATPPKFHEEYAIAAMKVGKYVYVEKPVTTSLASLDRMAAAEEEYKGKLTVAHYRRALPYFQQIKELVTGGTLGKIKLIRLEMCQPAQNNVIANTSYNWRVVPELSGGGLFYDLAPHQLDILIHIFGVPERSSGIAINQSKTYNAEDVVTAHLIFQNHIIMQGLWHFNMPPEYKKDSCLVIGENGSLDFAFFGNTMKIMRDGSEKLIQFQHPAHIHQPMVERTIDYFLGNAENPCSLKDARASFSVMEKLIYGDSGFDPDKYKF